MNAVHLNDLSVQLGNHLALDRLDLRIESGSFVAIVGPNGAGKTTLLKVLLGLIKPTTGSVTLLGQPPEKLEAPTVGYIPQVKTLDRTFPALAIELVITGLRSKWPAWITPSERSQAIEALKKTGADHLATRPIGQLSGGELQRVYLARSMVRRPRLILLDEPATGMDVTGQTDMYQLLENYRIESGATILMITHDWSVAYHHAGQVLVLNRKMISFGPPAEALKEQNLREAFGHVGHAHSMGPQAAHA